MLFYARVVLILLTMHLSHEGALQDSENDGLYMKGICCAEFYFLVIHKVSSQNVCLSLTLRCWLSELSSQLFLIFRSGYYYFLDFFLNWLTRAIGIIAFQIHKHHLDILVMYIRMLKLYFSIVVFVVNFQHFLQEKHWLIG